MFYIIVALCFLIVALVFVYRKIKSLFTFDEIDLYNEDDEAEYAIIKACMDLKIKIDLNYEKSAWVMRAGNNFGVGNTPLEAYEDLKQSIKNGNV